MLSLACQNTFDQVTLYVFGHHYGVPLKWFSEINEFPENQTVGILSEGAG